MQQDHWKDNTSRKLETLSHSVNRTLSTAPEVTATMAVVEDSWIRLSGTSKPMVALILKKAILMRQGKDNVVFNGPTWELQSPVRFSKNRGGVLPFKSLTRMCRWMGSHFHDWSDYNGVAFSMELLEWGRKFSNFGGK